MAEHVAKDGHCKFHFSSVQLHLRAAPIWEYLFVVGAKPFAATKPVSTNVCNAIDDTIMNHHLLAAQQSIKSSQSITEGTK